jgi:hypothetical protein
MPVTLKIAGRQCSTRTQPPPRDPLVLESQQRPRPQRHCPGRDEQWQEGTSWLHPVSGCGDLTYALPTRPVLIDGPVEARMGTDETILLSLGPSSPREE